MPAISKIRLTNIVYEEGNKRYNDEMFLFDSHNGAILLENGGGKTVLIQTALQAIIPHVDLADRKIKNTLLLENAPAHIAIEWIDNDHPRRYVVTAVSLFTTKQGLDSLRYVYEYSPNDPNGIEGIPFVREGREGKRTAEKGEMQDYYSHMREKTFSARTFHTIKEYRAYLEEQYHIISTEWDSIAKINSTEGGVEAFFDDCKTTNQLFDRLLIPTVENSIVGHEASIFADMFQQRLTSLKNYKKLKETIEENKQIQQELERYVHAYEILHSQEVTYTKTKQRVKGTWMETLEQIQTIDREINDVKGKLEEWSSNHHAYLVKSSSYDIYKEEWKLKLLDKDYIEATENKTSLEEKILQHQKEFYSLKLAELNVQRKEQEDKLSHANEELLKFDRSEEVENYEDHLDEGNRALLGWYVQEIEKLEKEEQGFQYQLNPILERIEEGERKKEQSEEEEKVLRGSLVGIQSVISSRLKDLEKLKQEILANPNQENVKDELSKWQERIQFLEEDIIRLHQEERQKELLIREAVERKENLQDNVRNWEDEKKEITLHRIEMDEAQTSVIQKLSQLRNQWVTLEDVYQKQNSIETRLLEEMEKLKKDRNSLLYQERIAYRFVDDYAKQDHFFGDAFLEEQLASWKNQVDYLVTGVEYLHSLDPLEKEAFGKFSLWPVTLVTTNKAKAKVIEKLQHVAEHLQFPIIVLSTEEALTVHKNDSNVSWIPPNHWRGNLNEEYFAEWKKAIGSRAQEKTEYREEKERQIRMWEEGLRAFHQFIEKYPFEKVSKWTEDLAMLNRHLEEGKRSIEKELELIEKLNGEAQRNKKLVESHREEKVGFERKVEKGVQYLSYFSEVEEKRAQEEERKAELDHLVKKIGQMSNEVNLLKEEREDVVDRKNKISARVNVVKEEDEYQSLKELDPIYTYESKQVLKDRIYEWKLKIEKVNRAQGEWIAKREAARDALDKLEDEVKELITDHQDLIENMEFPSDGKQRLKNLRNQLKEFGVSLEKATNIFLEKKKSRDAQEGKWDGKKDEFRSKFPSTDIIVFSSSLDEVAAILQKEKKGLDERKSFLDRELSRLEKEWEALESAKHKMELFVEGHHFNAPNIEALPLSEEEKRQYMYHRIPFVENLTTQLKDDKGSVDGERDRVFKARRNFSDFCRNKISDIKLQQMAISGVENKQTYEDIIDFKKNMFSRIESISQYANEHIRRSDEELQLFINQIHSHLLTLVEELKQIPKKTRVKVLDEWKQVFSFSIPEWEEQTGKMRIRDYIEWILQQLESERFLNAQGLQDDGKVRKEVETWLQSKQLLQTVMNNEVMKVTCRKVTNDNQVTTRSYTWEQSNVWSGGEKWSKNMTLFLGILNYVAEKKKHLQSNMKRSRAVILDNPFGKASSDHVLSPVFFIADQLGFQIIALTAHAEGKFLQDYFPVIYSCRLRASVDPNKKIMTKEKWLHHAYFQDHNPATIDRLGEVEQLELFD
ncbi:hypothetical protein RZN22_12800 [Bacillaceae bacterium S4-13-58]